MKSPLSFINPFQQADVAAAQLQAGTPVVQGEPGNIPPGTDPSADPAQPVIPTPKPVDAAGNIIPDAPLDAFATVWDTPKPKDGEPEPDKPIVTPESIAKIVEGTDFTQAATAEQLAAIQAGGEGAAAAVKQVVNSSVQQAVQSSILASQKVTDDTVQKAVDAMAAKIPELVRQQAITSHMKDANPLFSNPAVKPIMANLQLQLAGQNPDSSPQEITAQVQSFVEALAESVNPDKPTDSTGKLSGMDGDVDWGAYIGENLSQN